MKKYWEQLPNDFEVGERIIYQPNPSDKNGSFGRILKIGESTLTISVSVLDKEGFEVSPKSLRKVN